MKKPQLNYLTYASLFRSLALMTRSGVTLADGFLIIADEESDEAYSSMLRRIAEDLESGEAFFSALEKTEAFPAYATGLIDVAERVGKLEETLSALSRYYEERERMKSSILHALTYPSVILLMMFAVIVVLLAKVLPVFDEVYGSLGSSLTGFAGGLLAVGEFLSAAMPYIGTVLGFAVVIGAAIALSPSLTEKIKKLSLRLFGDRGVARKINNAHLAEALSLALSSGMPVEEGLELAERLLSDTPGALARCKGCRKEIEEGEPLPETLEKYSFLTKSSCRMLNLGIRSGNVDGVMEDIARRMSDEAESALEAATSRIEPALVLVTSFLVGAILIAVMLPLINIMKALG